MRSWNGRRRIDRAGARTRDATHPEVDLHVVQERPHAAAVGRARCFWGEGGRARRQRGRRARRRCLIEKSCYRRRPTRRSRADRSIAATREYARTDARARTRRRARDALGRGRPVGRVLHDEASDDVRCPRADDGRVSRNGPRRSRGEGATEKRAEVSPRPFPALRASRQKSQKSGGRPGAGVQSRA